MRDAHGPRREVPVVPSLLDKIADYGITAAVCIADKGYDAGSFYEACEARNVRPVAPLRQTGKVVAGDHLPPSCDHGRWTFAGSDAKRGAAKYRCPSGECSPASVWIKAVGCTPSSLGRRRGGSRSTRDVPPWSVSSDG